MKRIFSAAAAMVASALVLTACGGEDPLATQPTTGASASPAPQGTVVVGSANFPENVLLGSIYSQALQAKGVKVEEKFNIGSREVLYPQLESSPGELTVVPEYNGSLMTYLAPDSVAATTDEVNAILQRVLPPSLEILESAAAEDKDTLSVTKETAQEHGLTTIADLAKVDDQFVVGGPPEFEKRRKEQVKEVYGLEFKDWKPTGQTTADALTSGTIQVGNVFSTDPKLIVNGLVPLEDPKSLFAAQNITPLVNKAGVTDTVRETLNAVSAALDTATLVDMMKRVAIDKEDPPAVAKDWLTQNNLI